MTTPTDPAIQALIHRLSLDEKVQLLTGRDFWTTWPIPKIGLRRILVSDGPSGVRGETWDERDPSLNLPSATALSSSWDVALARRYGAASAAEARRKNVDVVLGPTINLHRSPLGGRHFEAFSEDPYLTAELAAAYVTGVQSNGVGATPKHYVANDFETDRFDVNVEVSDRALRELYLLAFEKAVTESHAWLVMSAYNSINGATATENELLETPLNSEWGFDGVVVSDWTAVRSLHSAAHSQDLVMPGPDGPWGAALADAVEAGDIAVEVIDRKVARLLVLAARVGALDGFEPSGQLSAYPEDGIMFARAAAAAGCVLVRNESELPWDATSIGSIAVIGHNAAQARTQGGGSATVIPARVISPLDGIREIFGAENVTYSLGAVVQKGVAEFAPSTLTNPSTNTPGSRVRFLDAAGAELFVEDRLASGFVYFGGDAPIAATSTFEFTTLYSPESTGIIRLGFAAVGRARIWVDGVLVLDQTVEAEGTDLGAALLAPPSASIPVPVSIAVPVLIRAEYDLGERIGALASALAFSVGQEPNESDPDRLIADAVAAARLADVALVVVGTNSRVESEGIDRTSLGLPGRQDDLVRAVAAVNPRTVVIVNSGSPVVMPWRNDVAAILLGYFGGQEFGHAIADILSGTVEPGGRLPTTWPKEEDDAPVLDVTPRDGAVKYNEGIHIGYRAWLKAQIEPAYPFGFGLGYTTWSIGELTVAELTDDSFDVIVSASNTGKRAGKHVVQLYAARPDSTIDRPVRWLVGFAAIELAAGLTERVTINVPRRAFAHWDEGWKYEAGRFGLYVGSSVASLNVRGEILINGAV